MRQKGRPDKIQKIPIYLVCQRMAINRRMVELKHLSICYHNILDVKLRKLIIKPLKTFPQLLFPLTWRCYH